MNDLAEKALHAAETARRAVAARPATALAAAGFALAAAVVVIGGRIGADPAAVPIDRWLGLLAPAEYTVGGPGLPIALIAAIAALVVLWLVTVRVSRLRRFRPAQVWAIALAWAVPFAVGPPQLSTDVYGYVARGLLARHGFSPYHHGAGALGNARVVEAIAPTWRNARSTDGPLATLAQHLVVAVGGGNVIAALILFRVIAVLSVIAIGRLATELSGGRPAGALCVTVLNPALLLYGISAEQLVAPLIAVLLGALVAAAHRRWVIAVLLCCVAAGLRPVALVALPAVIAVHAAGYPWGAALRAVARDVAVAVAALAAATFSVPFGAAWIGNISDAIHEHIPFAPASVAGQVVGWIVSPASFDDLATGGRIAAVAAAATTVGYLYATVAARPLDRTIGYALIAAGTLSPVVYPSFLMWGALTLAPSALGARRDWVMALSCAACVLAPVGFSTRVATFVTSGLLALTAVVLLPRLVVRHQHEPRLLA